MAKVRKTETPPVSEVKPVGGAKPTALTIRGDLKWREWVDGLADHCRLDVAKGQFELATGLAVNRPELQDLYRIAREKIWLTEEAKATLTRLASRTRAR